MFGNNSQCNLDGVKLYRNLNEKLNQELVNLAEGQATNLVMSWAYQYCDSISCSKLGMISGEREWNEQVLLI